MVAGKKPYPKATLKKIVKAHAGMSIRKNTDITVWFRVTRFPSVDEALTTPPDISQLRFVYEQVCLYFGQSAAIDSLIGVQVLTLSHRLVKEAAIHAKQSGERGLTARSVRKATRVCFLESMTESYTHYTD